MPIKVKKTTRKKFDGDKNEANKECKIKVKEPKQAVPVAKAGAIYELCDELDSPAGVRRLHTIARPWDMALKDFTQVQDKNRLILRAEENNWERWCDYYKPLPNQENWGRDGKRGAASENVTWNRAELLKALR
ncbi:hypothetical protein AAG570_011914 [Ranatra chinensis]|uniref:Uncharacterized protein n=1 Tax=Ranatra chinensis TaxID=642074 RepID=A0ABD0YVR6_9HEMI